MNGAPRKNTDIEPILLSVGGPEAFAEEIWPRSLLGIV